MSIWLLLLILYTMAFPELSLPIWITQVHLVWWKSVIVVFVLSLPVLFILFWPRYVIKIFPQKKREKIKYLFQKFINWLKSICERALQELQRGVEYFIRTADEKSEKKDYAISYLMLFIGTILFLFVLLVVFLKSKIRKIKNWFDAGHKKMYKRLSIFFQGLGYLGVAAGAGVPLVPGVRPAGVTTVIIMGTWQAKALFIFVEILRLLIEGRLWSKVV
jgi:hypothetical protein